MGSDSHPATESQPAVTPPALAEHSRFVQRIRRRYAAELPLLPAGLPRRDTVTALVATLRERGLGLASALRVARHLVLERLAVLDVEQGCAMEDVTLAMSELAEATLDLALAQAIADQAVRHGLPRTEAGGDIEFWVVGMGKLGARELNVSSDIDLVYVYEDDGQTDGEAPISAHEFFSKVARGLYALIGDTTDDGFVFRVDLALRPNGNSGPPVVSLAMLEEYLQIQGREWERFAWLKSRVVAPRASVSNGRALALRAIVNSFVYRKYLDYGVFECLRQLHRKVREEAQRRAAGRPERANDVKLSRGGIREIEFIVQLLLVVRGGQFPEMRTRSTLKALSRLAAAGLMKPESAARLADAYVFLRRVEHRIQYLDDQQTHLLPTGDGDLNWIARSLGLTCNADACELLDRLGEMREFVALEFDALLHDGRDGGKGNGGCKTCGNPPPPLDSEAFAEKLPAELAERVRHLCAQPKIQALREESKARLGRLIARAALAARNGDCTMEAAQRFVDWVEPLLRRESYLALLVERPEVQNRLLRLLGLARWPMRYLMRHPGVIDELADERLLHNRFDAAEFAAEL
ncbi:MAG: glutamine-synthetase adenylyltransferase, partial [Piscinibacter sp.]